MPTVPRARRQVQPTVTPGVQVTQATVDTAAGVGATTQALGELRRQAQDVFVKERNRARETAFMKFDQMSVDKANKLSLDLEKLKGEDAAGSAVNTLNELRKFHSEVLRNAPDDKVVRENLERAFAGREGDFNSKAQKWEFDQGKVDAKAKAETYKATLADAAVKNWDTPELIAKNIDQGKQAVMVQADADGLDEDAANLMAKEWASDVHVDVIAAMQASGEGAAAREYFEANRADMVAEDETRMQAALKEGKERVDAFAAADKIREQFPGSLQEQHRAVRAIEDPELRAKANSNINQMWEEDKRALAELESSQVTDAIDQVESKFRAHAASSPFGVVPPADIIRIDREDVWRYVDPDLWSQMPQAQRSVVYKTFSPPVLTKESAFRKWDNMKTFDTKKWMNLTEQDVLRHVNEFAPNDRTRELQEWKSAREAYVTAADRSKQEAIERTLADEKDKSIARRRELRRIGATDEEVKDQRDMMDEFERRLRTWEREQPDKVTVEDYEKKAKEFADIVARDYTWTGADKGVFKMTREELTGGKSGKGLVESRQFEEFKFGSIPSLEKEFIKAKLAIDLPGIEIDRDMLKEAWYYLKHLADVDAYDAFITREAQEDRETTGSPYLNIWMGVGAPNPMHRRK